jgi:hypothetical protein
MANAVPFPKGLTMVSGNPLARSYDNSTMTWGNSTFPPRPVADRVSFVCIPDYDEVSQVPQQDYMAFDVWGSNQRCVNGMRAQIQFQSCWDGINLSSADNSHVAYLSQIDNGKCPPTHPVQFIHLFFEMYYSVAMPQFDMSTGGKFYFAYGDPTGFGFHGDFLNGWDIDVLGSAIKQCGTGNTGGGVETCAPLATSNSNSYGQNCPEDAPFGVPVVDEQVHGMLGDKLPGCINLVDGPAWASLSDIACPPGTPQPALNSMPEQAPIIYLQPTPGQVFGNPGWGYVDCYLDGVNGSRTLSAAQTQSANMTVEYCQSWCSSNGWRFSGVEYQTQCFCDSQLPAGYTGGQTGCSTLCGGSLGNASAEYCGGANFISIYNNTMSTATIAAPGAGATPAAAGIYLGCATEGNSNGRALTGASIKNQPNMTLEYCRSYCTSKGFALAGTEYSTECYCGNALSNSATMLSSNATCNMLCSGSNQETCGGPNRLSIFGLDNGSTASCPSSDGTTLTVGNDSFVLNCGTDYAGGDLSMTYTSTVYACAASCSNTTGCVASSWVPGGPCYMKSAVGNANQNSGVWAVKKLNIAATHACPGDNGKNITVGSSVFTIQCGTDHAGGDLSVASALTIDACASTCAQTSGCVGASFVPGSPGVCYMKGKSTPANVNNGVWALVLANAPITSSSTSSTTVLSTTALGTVISSTVVSSTIVSSTIATSTIATSTIASNTTVSSTMILSTAGSSTASSITFATSAAVFTNTTTPAASTTTSTAAQATLVASKTATTTSSAASSTPTIVCPASNNTLVSFYNSTTTLNTTFAIQCSLDHPGNAGLAYTKTMSGCLAACANFTDPKTGAACTDVSYLAGGGACYMKTKLLPATGGLNSAVWGAIVVQQTWGNGTNVTLSNINRRSERWGTRVA